MTDLYTLFKNARGIAYDTRKLIEGDMFFALKTGNNDGKAYIPDAVEKGASSVVYQGAEDVDIDIPSIRVEDSLLALQHLATFHRNQLDIPVVAITGSNGKTTTKELVREVLAKKYKVQATEGNYNNHIGVPLTLLKLTVDHDIAVIEMGANHIGEIADLCKIAAPTHGLITSIGKAHLEGFGSLAGVIEGKTELYKYLERNDGVIFIDHKNDILKENIPNQVETVFYDYDTVRYGGDNRLEVTIDGTHFTSTLVGDYNATNISCAVAVGKYFNVSIDHIQQAIADYQPQMNRSQHIEKEGVNIILDAYNANPVSMKAAIENFARYQADRKVLILGDMLELGPYSEKEHQGIVELIKQFDWYKVYTVGKEFSKQDLFPNYSTLEEMKKTITLDQMKGCTVMLKGSRGIGLERFIN